MFMKTVIFQSEKMSISFFLLKLVLLFLLSGLQPLMANSSSGIPSHADPKLANRNSYGPIRANDTLWSIAKLLSKPNESIYQLIEQLKTTNPTSIKANNIVVIGKYIHRVSIADKTITPSPKIPINKIAPIKTASSKNKLKQASSIPLLITKTINYNPTAETYLTPIKIWDIPPLELNSSQPLNNQDNPEIPLQTSPTDSNYLFIRLGIIIISLLLFLITIKFKQRIHQQQLADAETTKINQLKRELIKNRLIKTLAINHEPPDLIQS